MEFDYLGAHCSVSSCKLRDFLPFACDGCNLKYCISHRCYRSHNCKKVPKGIQVITCPLCGTGIDIENEEEADSLWNMHYHSAKCIKKQVDIFCANPNCKQKLNLCNTFECINCKKQVCLQHRFSDQHKCVDRDKRNKCLVF